MLACFICGQVGLVSSPAPVTCSGASKTRGRGVAVFVTALKTCIRSYVSSKRSSGASSGSVGTLSNGAMKKVVSWIAGSST